jgi:hypothetical protein
MKVNTQSRNNYNTTYGILDLIDSWTNQSVTTTADPTFNSLTLTDDMIIGGNTLISGNLTVTGNTSIISSETVEIKDNIIEINSGQTTPGITLGSAGIEVNRGPLIPYRFVYEEASNYFKIGQIGSLQVVATREDAPLNKGAVVYNDTTKRLDSTQTFELPMTFSAGTASSSSSTGTVKITGGVGITGDIYTDGGLYFKGTGAYPVNITVSNQDNVSINLPAGKYASIPHSTFLSLNGSLATKTIYSDDTHITIEATSGNIYANTTSSLILPVNSFLRWGSGNNSIRYNGSNILVDTTGRFVSNAVFQVTNGTMSTSNSTGSVLLSGGVGINSTANAESSLNGGTITTAGGAAISRRLYVGELLDIADVSTTRVQVINEGINLRSRARTLVTSAPISTTFNSFEGGQITTSTTIPVASTVSILGAPTISGGGSITASYSLQVASGESRFGGRISSVDTTASTSLSTGSVLLSGGLTISNTTNAASYLSGGSITTGGGVGIGKDLFIAGAIDIGALNTTATQVFGEGINFRSRNKTLNTVSSVNTVFNSFEGGNINTASIIADASTVYINGSPTVSGGGSITNSYALWVAGLTRLDNLISVTGTTPSTSTTTGVITISGGVGIANNTDALSSSNGGTITTAGGAAIGKKLYVNSGVFTETGTNISTTSHYNLLNTNVYRFGLGLKNIETGSNSGSDFVISRGNDADTLRTDVLTIKRSSGDITLHTNTPSNSSVEGSLIMAGGLGISSTADASSSSIGGSITTAGGVAIAKKLYTGGDAYFLANVDIDGITYLDQTFINTNDGSLNVSGSNSATITVGNTSNFTTTSGSLSLISQAASVILNGSSSLTLDSAGGISIDAGATSNLTTSSGNMTVSATSGNLVASGTNVSITGSTNTTITGDSLVSIGSNTAINIGTANNSTPITIGHSNSEVYIGDNLTINGDLTVLGATTSIESSLITVNDNCIIINNAPLGTSDGGYLIRRYQTPNNAGTGEVVTSGIKESGLFQSGSSLPDILVLDTTANAVNNYYKGWWIRITSGAGSGQVRRILSYNGTTKEATLYSNTNTNANGDGLDLVTAPLMGDSYNLYDSPYVGMVFDESNKEIVISGINFDIDQGQFPQTTSYYPIHARSLVVEEGFTTGGNMGVDGTLTVDHDSIQALLIRKNGDSGNVFRVDTVNSDIYITNVDNTINSDIPLLFQQRDSVNSDTVYSSIKNVLKGNVAGNLKSNLVFSVQNDTGGLTEFLTLKGDTVSSVEVSSSVNQFKINNTTAATSNSNGALVSLGGISISNTTDAVSSTNGGSLTTAGGIAIAKKLYTGDNINTVATTKTSNTTNSFTENSGAINVNGDINLYNTSDSKLVFNQITRNLPAFTTRSSGTKIVLYPSISGSTLDYAFGVSNNSLWYSVPSTSETHSFYVSNTKYVDIDNNGIRTTQAGSGITFFNGSNTSSIKEVSENTRFKPHTTDITKGFEFRDATDNNTRIRVNSDGKMTLGITGYSGEGPVNGSLIAVPSFTFTDTSTVLSTITKYSSVDINQPQINADNAITTTNAMNMYIQGAVIKGTNQTLTNSYGLYIDNSNSVSSSTNISTAASLYIKGSPSGNVVNAYSLFIDDGKSRIDGELELNDNTTVSSNDNTLANKALYISGDTVSNASLFFTTSIGALPAYTTRSSGTKIVLKPNISGSSVDTSIGLSGNDLWYAASTTSDSHLFYLGNALRTKISNNGITVDSSTTEVLFNVNTTVSNDTKSIVITGGGASSVSRGSEIKLYGADHSTQANNIYLNSGTSGNAYIQTNGTTRFTVSSTGEISISSATETTSNSTGALVIAGGLAVNKSLFVDTSLSLNFNQRYLLSGNVSGHLDISSKTSGVASKVKYFTNDGDNTDDNQLELYGLGTNSNTTNSEYLRIGYRQATNDYIISTLSSGSGIGRSLSLQANNNSDQIKLNTDGTVSFANTLSSTSATSGALVLNGGISINKTTNATSSTNGGSITTSGGLAVAQDAYIGGNMYVSGSLSFGITTPSLTISNLVNTSAVTAHNVKNRANGAERDLSVIFRCTPTASNTYTTFEVALPNVSTNFTTIYDATILVSGHHNDTTPESVENCFGITVVSSTRIRISFTSAATDAHTIHVNIKYTTN